ncbi:unnamed protein product, partial [Tetraodon nigroviridis]
SEVHAAESVAYLNRALGLLDLMIVEEDELKKRLLKSIESCVKELRILYEELQMAPFEEEEGCTVLQMEKNNRTRLEVMKEHKKKRIEELKSLVAKDRELCRIICTSPFSIDQDSVPSLQQLKTYHAYLDDLTKEKERRHQEFVSIKKNIVVCMDDLEQEPETSFEMDVVCEDEEAFCLSDDNIAALKLLLSQLQQRKIENELCCLDLRTKIRALWERLQIPQEEREALSEHMGGTKKRNVEALQTELQRLEVLKMNSIRSFIEAIRAEIAQYWEKCFYSPEQRKAFAPYHTGESSATSVCVCVCVCERERERVALWAWTSAPVVFLTDDFTEEVLNLHEAEVKMLEQYYEDHRELFEGVAKWQENWTLYLELDKKNNDPSRFNNRGGNLLKEEKQRTDLQKSLPKLEKCLKAQIDMWEQERGTEFQVNGQPFLEYVQQQWERHHSEKEKEKLERVSGARRTFPPAQTPPSNERARFSICSKTANEENQTDAGGNAVRDRQANAVQEAPGRDSHACKDEKGGS